MSTTNLVPSIGDPAETDQKISNLRDFLSGVAASSVLDSGLSQSAQPIEQSADAIFELANQCLSSAFVTWSHRMTLEYVDRFGSKWLKENRLPELLLGTRIGSTALATALADRSGKELLPITFVRVGDDYVIDGVVPWASNLYQDTLVVFAAREPHTGERVLFATELSFDGISVKPAEGLLALNATSSGTIRFAGLKLSADYVLTNDVNNFFSRMRPRFLLLQSAFCLGLSQASLDSALASESNKPFTEDLAQLESELTQAQQTWRELLSVQNDYASLPGQQDPLPYLKLRLQAALLAQSITRIELASVGGRGYFVTHPTSRRIRESLFLSIQAPTEGSLRWEISQLQSKA
jgi:alkylation response protein AidB-like acyl-CoA dehydrogenase